MSVDVWRNPDGSGAVRGEMLTTWRRAPGDRLMLPQGTVHTAIAGPQGATYLIGERSG